jgi:hypothetical protein
LKRYKEEEEGEEGEKKAIIFSMISQNINSYC